MIKSADQLATVRRWKLAWFGHVTHHDSLSKTILQGTFEDGRRRGWRRKGLMNNIKDRVDIPAHESSLMSPPSPPPPR